MISKTKNKELQIIDINDVKYYQTEDMFDIPLIYTKGSRNARELIKKKKIGEDNYIFARNENGEW